MDSDLFLIVGIVVAVMAFPAVISAYSAARPPRAAAIAAVVGGALMVVATVNHPGGYRAQDIPDVAVRVMDRYLK
jgi:NAD(P)H-hydrate repair Nnr-like enzyme with NAD(P)H-hydrate dehydratase domain